MIEMRAILASVTVLALAACGSEVEPETIETIDEAPAEVVESDPVPELGSAYSELSDCLYGAPLSGEPATSQARCDGHAGYELVIRRSDQREGLAIVSPEGEEQVLDLAAHVTDGRVNRIGRTVEWRGSTPDAPEVLIARVDVANDEDPMAPDTSFLAVVRLESPACIVARVPPGPGQLVAARRFADRETLPDCLSGAGAGEDPAETAD